MGKCNIEGSICSGDWLAKNGDCDRGPYPECTIELLKAENEALKKRIKFLENYENPIPESLRQIRSGGGIKTR